MWLEFDTAEFLGLIVCMSVCLSACSQVCQKGTRTMKAAVGLCGKSSDKLDL